MREKLVQVYTNSLFFAIEKDTTDLVLEELNVLNEVVSKNDDLLAFFNSLVLSFEKKKEVFDAGFSSKLNSYSYNFFLSLLKRNRVNLLRSIIRDFSSRIDDMNNIQRVNFRSSIQPSESLLKKVQFILQDRFSKKILIDFKLDKSIKNGFILTFKDYIIDCSLMNKVAKMKKFLLDFKIDSKKDVLHEN